MTSVTIHLAAHSMGGLVSRYYLQSGDFEAAPGFDRIATFLTFGTPHKGAAVALAGAIGQNKAHFLNTAQTMALANNPLFPALYQTFPQPGSASFWDSRPNGKLLPLEVFDEPEVIAKLNLTAASIEKGRNFFSRIAGPWPDIRTFLFVGSRFETGTHFMWDGQTTVFVKTKDGGDGTVNLQGSVLESQQIRFTNKNHLSLIEAAECRTALQQIFGADGLLSISPTTILTLSVGDLFLENRQPVEIAISVSGPSSAIEGALFLERARAANDALEAGEADFDTTRREFLRDLTYDGPELSSIHVFIEDVVGPAVFRPVFVTREDVPRRFVGPAFVVKRPDD